MEYWVKQRLVLVGLAVPIVLFRELELEELVVFKVVFLCSAIAEILPKQVKYDKWRSPIWR